MSGPEKTAGDKARDDMGRKLYVVNQYLTDEHRRILRKTAEECGFDIEIFNKSNEAAGKLGDAEVIFGTVPELVTEAKELKWCASAFAGPNRWLRPGILPNETCVLTSGAGAYGITISEHVIMAVLMLLKKIPVYQERMARKEWTKVKDLLSVGAIYGSRVSVLGTGDIGRNIARRMKAMGASRILGFNHSGKSSEPAFDQVLKSTEIDSFLPETDILTMNIPITPETEGFLSRERIALLPENAIVVNVGRGLTVDQDALVDALNEERIAGAALDVMVPEPLDPENRLWTAKNCFLTPHVAGNLTWPGSADRSIEIFCDNLRRYAAGKPLMNVVDRELQY